MKDLLEKYVEKEASVYLGGLSVYVIVKDIKVSWGKERYLVSPLYGVGEVWVESIKLLDK